MTHSMTQDPFYTTLPARGRIVLSGPDRAAFLQDLVTQDIRLLTPDALLYSCLLTPQGKFLHDFFILAPDADTILLDCEGGTRTQDLFKRLTLYRLRKRVELTCGEDAPVYGVFGEALGWPDPRHPEMGFRSYEKPQTLPESPFCVWDHWRITLGIPDGSRDLVIGQSTLDEGRIEALHGVSYDKGCYVGQELTARMHYRGLGKKHLQRVPLSALPAGAELRSTCGDIGLALVKAV